MYGLVAKTLLLFHLFYLPEFNRSISPIFLQYFFSTFVYFMYYLGQVSKRKWFNGNEFYILIHNVIVTSVYTYVYIEIHSVNKWIHINTFIYFLSLPIDMYYAFNKWFRQNFVIELADDRVYQHVY